MFNEYQKLVNDFALNCCLSIGFTKNQVVHATGNRSPMRNMCPYLELPWSSFSRIRTEYREIRSISSYSVRMRENADQNNSEYWHFVRSASPWVFARKLLILCQDMELPSESLRNTFLYFFRIIISIFAEYFLAVSKKTSQHIFRTSFRIFAEHLSVV